MCAPKKERLPLVLASTSPRRRQLLALLGLPFEVRAADVNESSQPEESPAAIVARLAEAKARAVLADASTDFIVAADTLVYLDGAVLGKPSSAQQALRMLERLRGRPHVVFSGVTVINAPAGLQQTAVAQSTVWMRQYSDAEIQAYVASGDPLDKAGAYAFQNASFAPASRVEGCYLSVMGLPLCHLYVLLRELGCKLGDTPVSACNDFTRRICPVAATILGGPSAREDASSAA